jgi:hypothetical protein
MKKYEIKVVVEVNNVVDANDAIGELHIQLDKALSYIEREDLEKREPKRCDKCKSTNTTPGIHCFNCGITQIKA